MLEPNKGVFATVSSGAGTIGQKHGEVSMLHWREITIKAVSLREQTNAIYGQSKVCRVDVLDVPMLMYQAAVNFFIAKLHYSHPELIILALNPGWVPTYVLTRLRLVRSTHKSARWVTKEPS
jgi:hypothetical protein